MPHNNEKTAQRADNAARTLRWVQQVAADTDMPPITARIAADGSAVIMLREIAARTSTTNAPVSCALQQLRCCSHLATETYFSTLRYTSILRDEVQT